MSDGFAIGLHGRAGAFKGGRVPADHDGKGSILGAQLAAADGRVEELDARGGESLGEFACGSRHDGGVIDNDQTGTGALKHPVRTENNLFNIRRIRQAGENNI